jgi:hypothetical protein
MLGKHGSENHHVRTGENTYLSDDVQSKSNAELLEEIEAMMAKGLEVDTEVLERYLAILQERAPVMEHYALDAQLDELKTSHPLFFEEEPAPENTDSNSEYQYRRKGGRFLRAGGIAVAAMLVFVMTANAFEVNPLRAIWNWADGIVQIYVNPSGIMELPDDSPSEYRSLEAALEANGISYENCPKRVPKDYILYDVDVKSTVEFTKYSATYQAERGELMIRIVQLNDAPLSSTEEREPGGFVYPYGGIEYYIVSNVDQNKAGWQIGNCSYVISGHITENELKEMIHSIS